MSSENPIFVHSRSPSPVTELNLTLPFVPTPTLGMIALEWTRFDEEDYNPREVARFIRTSGEILFHLMEEEMNLRGEIAAVSNPFLPLTFPLTPWS